MSAQRFPYIGPGGREGIPDSLKPPPGYQPELTRDQRARQALSDHRRRACGLVNATGRPLSPRAVRLLGEPCPIGLGTESGYNNHGCRCEACRAAHRTARLERMHRSAA